MISSLSVDDAWASSGVSHHRFPFPKFRMQRSCALIATNLRRQSTSASAVSRAHAIVDVGRGRFALIAGEVPLALLMHPFPLELTVESVMRNSLLG